MRGRRLMALGVSIVVLASCAAPSAPTPTPAASVAVARTPATNSAPSSEGPNDSQRPTGVATAPPTGGPTPTAGPLSTPQPAQPTSGDLILADLDSGKIDEPTATLYRVYALFDDERLPVRYNGTTSDDASALDIATEHIDSYPLDIRTNLAPFLLRPSDPKSYWAAPVVAMAAAARGNGLAQQAVSACVNGWITRPARVAPALIWGQCGIGAAAEADVAERVDEAITDIDDLWGPMTALMGAPIGDKTYPGDATEANDGKLDIYIVDYKTSHAGRDINPQAARGVAPAATPYTGTGALASSTYVVINGPLVGTGLELKDTIAHEFFHSLQAAHNRRGTKVNGGYFWMVEASATWAEHEFVPAWRPQDPYLYWAHFQGSALSLSSQTGENPYYSWTWPLFMAQEKGPPSIAAAWKAMEGKSGFDPLMSAVDNQLPFENRFRDFAVRVWDEDLEQGDPVKPRFQVWDPGFPLGAPGMPRWHYQATVSAQGGDTEPIEVPETVPSLWASYSKLKVEPDVGQLVLDFTPLSPTSALDVDALVEIKDKGWERRKLPPGETRFCLDDDADNVQNLVIVVSNHDKNPAVSINGLWTYHGLRGGCADLRGTLTVTRVSTYNSGPGAPLWTNDEKLTATILVDMYADPDPNGGGGYIDAHSSFTIARTTLQRRQMGDCTASFGTKTNGQWDFTDQPLGPDWVNSITGYADYPSGIVQLAVVVHYPYQVTEDVCNLFNGSTADGVHDLFACTGADGFGGGLTGKITQVPDGPDTVTFNCRQEGPALDYTKQTVSVSGTLQLFDEDTAPTP